MSGSRAGELNKGGTFDLRLGIKRMGNVIRLKIPPFNALFLIKELYLQN